jgi:hypothetical protein
MGKEQYDAMHARFAPLAGSAAGFVAHIAGPTDGGWYMIEVWESKADHERFMRETVLPNMPPGGSMPSLTEFEVYSRQTRDQLNA